MNELKPITDGCWCMTNSQDIEFAIVQVSHFTDRFEYKGKASDGRIFIKRAPIIGWVLKSPVRYFSLNTPGLFIDVPFAEARYLVRIDPDDDMKQLLEEHRKTVEAYCY